MADISATEVDELLQAIAPDAPCGPNLEYDPVFLQLEEAALGKPEVQYGGSVTPAVPPDWKIVRQLAFDLLSRSRDLRIAVPLTRALLALQGMTGFASGMHLIEGLLATHWDSVHPQLDPDDDNDPMTRINTLSTLAEFTTILREVRDAPLVVSRAHGRFSLRSIDIANGELDPAEGEARPALGVIDAAFDDMPDADLQALVGALTSAAASNTAIETILNERVGAAQSLDLSAPGKLLRRAGDFVRERLTRRGGTDGDSAVVAAGSALSSALPSAGTRQGVSGDITSRADVTLMLDKICGYYARAEPSSPIPLLLQRAQRLVDKNFMEILQDLTPDGLAQLYTLSGTSADSASGE